MMNKGYLDRIFIVKIYIYANIILLIEYIISIFLWETANRLQLVNSTSKLNKFRPKTT